MKRKTLSPVLLSTTAILAALAIGAGAVSAAHPPVPLKTYEEVSGQLGPEAARVRLDPVSKQGMPYSPKQTCGAAGCHDGVTVQSSVPTDSKWFNKVLKSYDALADHAFHSALGTTEWTDSSTGGFDTTTNRQKPWLQTKAMWGKW